MNDHKIRSYRILVIVAAVVGLLLGGSTPVTSAGASFTDLTAREAREFIDTQEPFILDVRTPGEFQQGHLPDAALIPVQELAQRIGEIAKYQDRKIFIYCRSGNRSVVASNILIQAGFTDLYNLRYGIREWHQAGFPIVVPRPSS